MNSCDSNIWILYIRPPRKPLLSQYSGQGQNEEVEEESQFPISLLKVTIYVK